MAFGHGTLNAELLTLNVEVLKPKAPFSPNFAPLHLCA